MMTWLFLNARNPEEKTDNLYHFYQNGGYQNPATMRVKQIS